MASHHLIIRVNFINNTSDFSFTSVKYFSKPALKWNVLVLESRKAKDRQVHTVHFFTPFNHFCLTEQSSKPTLKFPVF